MTWPPNPSVVCPVLIGRASSLTALNTLIEQARDGHAATALITGEAGIGKSRLVAEAKAHAAQLGVQTLQGNCFEPDRSFPYAPLLDLLRTFLSGRSADDITKLLGATAPELVNLLPELAITLPDLTPTASLEPEQEKRRLFQTLTQFFVGRSAPLLLVIEDLHWSDDTSLEFLLSLARHLSTQPILLALTYRSDEINPSLKHFLATLDRERIATEFTLNHLSMDEVDSMLRAIFSQPRPVRAEFLEALYALTEGNPFFIEESLKSLVSAGEIFYASGGWTRRPLSELHIPRSVQDAVQRRTQHLSEPARQVLRLAAVAGRRFDFALLQAITQLDEAALLRLIKEMMAAQLIVEESADTFAFRHALTRATVYADLLARERKALHRAMAEAIERLALARGADALEAHIGDLAYHFDEADEWAQALTYAQRAGEQAQRLYAPRAAAEHFTRAIEAAHHLKRRAPSALYDARAKAFELVGDFEAAQADYEHALEAARLEGDRRAEWSSLLNLGFLWTGRDYQKAGDYFSSALELARAMDDPITLAHSLKRMGNWYANAEQPAVSLQYLEEALAIFQSLNDPRGLAETFDLLGTTSYMSGDLIKGNTYYRQASALFRELDDRQGLSSCLAMTAMSGTTYFTDTAVWPLVDMTEALRAFDEAIQLARGIDWQQGVADAMESVGIAVGTRGEYARAFAYAREGYTIASAIEHRMDMVFGDFTLGALSLDVLALDTAQQYLERARAESQLMRMANLTALVAALLARTYVAAGKLTAAESLLAATLGDSLPALESQAQRLLWYECGALALARGNPQAALEIVERVIAATPNIEGGKNVVPRLWWLRGEALAAMGRAGEAETALQAARETAHAQGAKPILWRICVSLGRLSYTQGKRARADEAWRAGRAIVEELAAGLSDASLRDHFAQQATALFPPTPVATPRQVAKREFGGLTAREREVATLIAQGKSNREMAETLVISLRTVEVHVANIMSKLGFDARAQIAAWAVAKGLASGE